MNIDEILNDKSVKPKEKTETLSRLILDETITLKELIDFAKVSKDSPKATCIEALEYATKINPSIATLDCLKFVSDTLTEKAPRVKWESAKVVGNIAHLFPTKLDTAIKNLLINTEHAGTVVRWSAAFALGEIIKIKQKQTQEVIPAIKAICEREEKNSIKKIYVAALKKVEK